MPKLSALTDYDPMGNYTGTPVEQPVAEVIQPSASSSAVDKILNKLFRDDDKRYQLWPEKVVREALDNKEVPQWAVDPATGEVHTSPQMIEKAQAVSALAGTGGLAGGAEGAVLNATPSLRPALKYKDRLYKGKEGQQHMDVIPEALYPEFQKMAMSGEDISHYNFGFVNDKGHFLDREAALKYAVDTGMVDKFAGQYGALTSTLLADSTKPGMAVEAMAKAKPEFKIKGFEDYNDWYHGTTHTFDKFSKAKGNEENYLGKHPHFTNSSRDASANYAGFGPDLTNRIESLAEQIFQKKAEKYRNGEVGDDYGKVMTAAKREAAEKLAGSHEGAIVPANLKLDNPVSLVDSRPTWLDFNPKYDKAGEIIGESPLVTKLYKSLEKQAKKYDFDPKKVMTDLGDHLFEDVKASTFDKALRNSEALQYAEGKNGKLVGSDIIANIYKDMGFDGIVMDAKAAFPHMKDIPDGTLHAAPLKRNTVQSKITGEILYANGKPYVLTPVDYEPEFK